MVKDFNENIFNYIKESNDLFDNVVLLRLYDDYKINNKYIEKSEVIDIVNVNVACERLLNKLDKIKSENNDKDYERLLVYKNMLLNYVNNFDIKNKEKMYNLVCLITVLESYFKLPISFPNSLKDCIESRLNKKVNKRMLK